ncbi:MAG: pyridoxamine 5'-phosphate oxidase family protein [Tissierellaceae bacterium]|nr:pyridoxamine 5'-phosphate oxidase family protein [Tissierellaceae bacterium]
MNMFREMRRKKQLLTKDETVKILNACTSGVLGVNGDDGYPYTVPISYVYEDGKIFIHCAKEGHKIDSIKRDNKVSFSVIEKDDIVQEEFTSYFRSVSIFGKARILTDDSEKEHALTLIIKKYSPDFADERLKRVKDDTNRTCLIEINVEHMTGKAAIEIINKK